MTSTCAYDSSETSCAHAYLLPAIERIVAERRPERIFDLGCGNGSVANVLSRYAPVIGVDPSTSGVEIANANFPHLKIEVGSAYDDLAARYGTFPRLLEKPRHGGVGHDGCAFHGAVGWRPHQVLVDADIRPAVNGSGVGRLPALAKSMIAVATKPAKQG